MRFGDSSANLSSTYSFLFAVIVGYRSRIASGSFRDIHFVTCMLIMGCMEDVTRAEFVRETGGANGTYDEGHHEDSVELWIPQNLSKVVEVKLGSTVKEDGEVLASSEQPAVSESYPSLMTPIRMLSNA
ncbi:hypothetical protein BJ742DRAFT_779378 [Cladochytrium replicatum]|nr:hypothetical protein BJ742DRAFT_779378 [Cladochytrium replicatum]